MGAAGWGQNIVRAILYLAGQPVSASNPVPVSLQGSGTITGDVVVTETVMPDGYTAVATGRKVVATAGTREALAASTACKSVLITAELDNTGVIVVGGAAVVAALATRQGTPLNPGQSATVPVSNLALVYLDTTVNGDGVTYSYYN